MKANVLISSLAVAAVAAVGAVSLQAVQPKPVPGYAETLYADYAQASGQQATFEIRILDSGRLKQLEGRSFEQIVGAPRYQLEADETPLALRNARFKDDLAVIDRHELDAGVEGFDAVGLPVDLGTYRLLAVSTSIKGVARKHQAIEMCWESQGHCVVFDPSIGFLDSIVNNQRLAKAVGYKPLMQYEERPRAAGDVSTQAVCALASNTNAIGKSLTWAAWTQRYKNVFGVTLVTKNLGGQQAGIRCNSSCNPAPYGYSNSSSGSGSLGYNVSCDWDLNSGTTGRTGRWVAETKCAHRFAGSASAQVTRSGSGSGVSLSWDTNGGVDANGGRYTDTCGYF